MKLKSFAKLALSAVMSIALCSGCASNNAKEASNSGSGKIYKVGVCQLVQHDALDAATKGFTEKLKELLGEYNVEIDVQNASNDVNTCSTIVNQFVSNNVDLIMANATPALQAAMSATSNIPIVGTSVTDYGVALEINEKDWKGKTGINVTGASDLPPLDKQAEMLTTLLPSAKKIGVLYCSSEANSKYQVDKITEYLEAAGLEVIPYSFADSNDLSLVCNKIASDKVDGVYIPTDNTCMSFAEVINNTLEPAKIPAICGEENLCAKCGIATLSVDYYDIGVAAANQAYEILAKGSNPAEMDIAYSKDFKNKYVKSRCDVLGIKIPSDYVEIKA